MQQGLLGRISRTALMEYHAFGIIRFVLLSLSSHLSVDDSDLIARGLTLSITIWSAECKVFGPSLRLTSLVPNRDANVLIGDFTKGLVSDPPKTMWTREIKVHHKVLAMHMIMSDTQQSQFAGVSNTSKLYRRGIRICTGTGIGAALSTCLQNDGWFFIWIGSDQHKTFGSTIHNLIVNNIPAERRILWDSKQMGGRPDTMRLIEDTYRTWNAEGMS